MIKSDLKQPKNGFTFWNQHEENIILMMVALRLTLGYHVSRRNTVSDKDGPCTTRVQ